jgi:hypothetical protein
MLILLVCAVLAVGCGASGEDMRADIPDESSRDTPVSGQSDEAAVLAELNETCEENWCYGEFDYEFLALECGESTCELFFRAERGGEELEDSVVFEYDEPLVEDGYLEAGNWERVNDAISDGWEPAQNAN